MTTERKIEILTEIEYYLLNGGIETGLCNLLQQMWGDGDVGYWEMHEVRSTLEMKREEYFGPLNTTMYRKLIGYWWLAGEVDPRLKFIRRILRDLERELTNSHT
jgi:hypothetical protein